MGLSQDAFGAKIGVSGKYVGMIERGDTEISSDNTIGILFQMLSDTEGTKDFASDIFGVPSENVTVGKSYITYGNTIPIVGMAHAGINEDYDEAVQEWRDTMVSTCPDEDARGVKILGDCMSPFINEDDVLVAMPSRKPSSGGIAVARFKDGGVIVRRFEFTIDQKVTAIATNIQYPTEYYTEDDFEWIWPVWDMHRKIWRD